MDTSRRNAPSLPLEPAGPGPDPRRWDRRSLLAFGGSGLALAGTSRLFPDGDARPSDRQRRRTRQTAARLLRAIASRDTTAIWSLFAPGGAVDLPFLALQITDFATLDAVVGPLLADLGGLTFTRPTFVDLADPNGVIAKFHGSAVVGSTGKPYEQTYISLIYVRHELVTSYTEYFDTAVLNEAFTPA